MKKLVILCTFFILGISFGALAQSATPLSDTRQAAQRARIHEGRASGEVTNGEAAKLNSEQRRIRRTERRAKADGEVTTREKAKIERKQSRANRHIRRAKHNTIEK